MQSFTNKDKKKKLQNKLLKSINSCKKKKNLYSQSKTNFCYFNIVFEISRTIIFFVLGIQNTKYLPFKTPNVSTLIFGWLRFFIFILKFCFC